MKGVIKMETQTRRVALAVMAHPDDAEILCGGTLIRLRDLGWDVHICTCTPGDCGSTTENRWQISSRRTTEGATAAARIGATYHCLDERDCFVCYDKTTLAKMYDLFRRVAPTLLFTHAPRDYMCDHEQASYLARAAAFGHGTPNVSHFPLLPGTCIPHLYYCDTIDGRDPLGAPIQPTTRIDVTDVLERKLEMLACHVSQREWLQAYHGIDEYLDSVRRHTSQRGTECNVPCAEVFVQHRGHAYPKTDLLDQLLGGL